MHLSLNEQCEGTLGIYTSKPFQWYPKSLIWYFFSFWTKALNIRNSHTYATPKVGVHLGIIGLHLLHSPHLKEFVSLPNTFSWPHMSLHFTLSHEPDVKVVTNNTLACHKSTIIKTRKKFTRTTKKKKVKIRTRKALNAKRKK